MTPSNICLNPSKIEILESLGFIALEAGGQEFMKNLFLCLNIDEWESAQRGTLHFFKKETNRCFIYFSITEIVLISRVKTVLKFYLSLKNENISREIDFGEAFLENNCFEDFIKKVEFYFSWIYEVYEIMMKYGDREHRYTNYDFLYIFPEGVLFSVGEDIFFIESDVVEELKDIQKNVYDKIESTYLKDLPKIEIDKDRIRNSFLIIFSRSMIGDVFSSLEKIKNSIKGNRFYYTWDNTVLDFKVIEKYPEVNDIGENGENIFSFTVYFIGEESDDYYSTITEYEEGGEYGRFL